MNRPLFSIVFLAGAGLAAFFFTWPSLQDFQFLQLEKRSKAKEFENREEYFANLTSLERQLKDFGPELARLDYALPEDTSLPSLYQLLQEVAAGSGVVLKSISAQVAKGPLRLGDEASDSLKTITLEVKVAGPYESFKQFLQSAQNAWRLLSIDSVAFVSPPSTLRLRSGLGASSSFEVSFRMQAYSY